MGIEKLIHCLQCCARVDAHNGGCDDCGLEYCGPECQQLCGTAATALSTLQAENEEMQKQLNMFSEFLCYMTGGLLSKTNYTAQEMATAAEDYQQKVCGECDLRAENEKLRADVVRLNDLLASYQNVLVPELRTELEQVKWERDAALEHLHGICSACKNYSPYHNRGKCRFCAYEPARDKDAEANDNWEWRGQKKD